MEQTNYQELNKKLFSDYTANPSALGSGDSKFLETSLEKFPYCQLLHSFYTRSLSVDDPDGFEKQLSKTALFFPDRKVLYTLIEDSEKLKSFETDTQTPEVQSTETTAGDIREIEQGAGKGIPSVQTQDTTAETAAQQVQDTSANIADENFRLEEPGTAGTSTELITNEEQQSAKAEDTELSTVTEPGDAAILIENILSENNPGPPNIESASTENNDSDILVATSETPTEPADQKISKYDDDKLPYSFLWWLSTTRKEHSDTYQPYVVFKLDTSQNIKRNTVDQLSSQIIENIFHLQSPVDQLEDSPRTIPFQVKRKEDYVLEKFIKEEPQIKAPNSQKLDTENKARKSAEDSNDLVSETLAQIYTDQMLFHKAIDTYKKLSLKFPEKSTYFVDQICELEKKIN